MKLIFLGLPGTGKGSVAKEIMKLKNIPQIAAGDLARAFIAEDSELGREAKKYYDAGKLVPDEIFVKLLRERISQEDCKKGFILDGFPRSFAQAEILDKEVKIDKVINFNLSRETILMRISNRRICEKCGAIYNLVNVPPKIEGVCDCCEGRLFQRKDDSKEVVEKRLIEQNTEPLVDYYKQKGNFAEVDVEGELDKNVRDTLEIIDLIED